MDGQTQSVPRVLLVDDDAEFLPELRDGLEALGIPVLTADTAEQALTLVQQHEALQIVVTDLQMPRIDGIEMLQKLSLRKRKRPLVGIVITGHASLERAVGALRLHVVDFLQKPVTAEEVANAIHHAFARLDMPADDAEAGPANRPNYLRALVAAQADRMAIFKVDLFSDPAWNMMLDLAVAESSNRFISVTSLCIASGAPTTTALRRIDDLKDAGLVDKMPDPLDKRRIMVRLTPLGRERMDAFLKRQANRFGVRMD